MNKVQTFSHMVANWDKLISLSTFLGCFDHSELLDLKEESHLSISL